MWEKFVYGKGDRYQDGIHCKTGKEENKSSESLSNQDEEHENKSFRLNHSVSNFGSDFPLGELLKLTDGSFCLSQT